MPGVKSESGRRLLVGGEQPHAAGAALVGTPGHLKFPSSPRVCDRQVVVADHTTAHLSGLLQTAGPGVK